MSVLRRLFQRNDPKAAMLPLYHAIVARGREAHWFEDGAVPDTLDGRFDMIAAVLCAVLLRLEHEDTKQQSVWLTEVFIDDMDGQLRTIGIGDMMVGKHIGKMMSALGGRLTAYRAAFAGEADLGDALVRNLYRGAAPDGAALAHSSGRLAQLRADLDGVATPAILAGQVPQ